MDYTEHRMSLQETLQSLRSRSSQPLLVVISGPSGVGKDAVIQCMKARDLPFNFVVTATSRPQREGEIEGQDYFFVTPEAFQEMIENDELLEHALVYGDHKGIPKQQVREALESGKDVVMRVDVQGARTIRSLIPDALLIFLGTRTEQELIDRLKRRRTESEEALRVRVATMEQELEYLDIFDYYIVNAEDELEETVDIITAIIRAEHHRTKIRRLDI
jgi:guanylate kinase